MKNVTIKKSEFDELDAGNNIELTIAGFPAFAEPTQYGEFKTPKGTHFYIGFYNPPSDFLKINGKEQYND